MPIVQALCTCCDVGYITSIYDDGTPDEEGANCHKCGEPMRFVKPDDVKDPEALMELLGSELENANYHSMTELPHDIYRAAEKLVPEDKRIDLARAIYDNFPKG